MKLAALTMRSDRLSERCETVDMLDARWHDFLALCGFAVLPLPNNVQTASLLLQRFHPDAIVLTGGGNPLCVSGCREDRDSVEALAIEWAEIAHVPVIGVCRGMQVLLGREGVVCLEVFGHVCREHIVAGDVNRTVNSFHRFGPVGSVRPFYVLGRSSDGVIECIADPQRARFGMMWHPERQSPFSTFDVQLFRDWLESAPSQEATVKT